MSGFLGLSNFLRFLGSFAVQGRQYLAITQFLIISCPVLVRDNQLGFFADPCTRRWACPIRV